MTHTITRAEAETAVKAIRRTCRGPLAKGVAEAVTELLERGELTKARHVDAAGRAGCGADFNTVVLAGPLDGGTYEYECPQCGLTGTYTAPRFDLEAEA